MELTASFFTLSLIGTCFASKSLGKSLMMLLGTMTLGPNSLQGISVMRSCEQHRCAMCSAHIL